jgi:ubiquinone/menaquinone biosynthesis C-methylase UbiE
MGHRFNPANADRLVDPARAEWNNPEQILPYLNLGGCMTMLDVGCGPGWFTLEAARKLPDGLVCGVDVSDEMLAKLKERTKAANLHNVQAVLAEEEAEYPIPTESVDVALIANVYHEVDPASMFLGEIKRVLRPASVCLVVEWKVEETPVGPPLEERVDQQDVVEEFYSAGFVLAGTCDVGPYHYGLKFYRPKGENDPVDDITIAVP